MEVVAEGIRRQGPQGAGGGDAANGGGGCLGLRCFFLQLSEPLLTIMRKSLMDQATTTTTAKALSSGNPMIFSPGVEILSRIG